MENFDHPHIIKLVGVCFDETLFIVMELAKFGQLARYLQANKDHIEINTLILYCYQLNAAMAYLESKKFVHRYGILIHKRKILNLTLIQASLRS